MSGLKRVFIGVDGGGTKTEVLAVSEAGELIRRVVVGPSNINVVGVAGALGELKKAFSEISRYVDLSQVEYCVFGFAGAGRRRALRKYESIVRELGVSRYHVTTDIHIALAGATGGGEGILVIAGTGSVVAGRGRGGEFARALGWGYVFDDPGSCYWLGKNLMLRALREEDGLEPPRGYREVLLIFLKTETVNDALDWAYQGEAPATRIASLVQELGEAWFHPPLVSLLDEGLRYLAQAVKVVAEKLQLDDPIPVYYTGGLFRLGSRLLLRFNAALSECGVKAILKRPRLAPAKGAVLLAFEAANAKITKQVISKLARV